MATVSTASVIPSAEVEVVERQIAPGSFLCHIDELDPTAFKNPRGEMLEKNVILMQHSLKHHGQISSIAVSKIEGSAKLGVNAGWTRTEATIRNVHDPLIRKWNEEHGIKTASEPGWMMVSNPDHRKIVREAYPEDYLKHRDRDENKLYVIVDPKVKTAGQAFMKGFIENTARTDMSLVAEINAIETMIGEYGYKQGEVARATKISDTQVSLMRKIGRLPAFLRTLLITPEAGEVIPEAELTKLKEDVTVLMDEFERRLALPKDDEEMLSYSHCREFAGKVMAKDKKADAKEGEGEEKESTRSLTRVQVLDLLCWLVGANDKSHKLNAKTPPEQYPLFMSRMKRYEQATAAKREGKGEAVAPATPTTDAGSAVGAVDGLAKAQADATTPATPATPAVSSGNAPAVAPATPATTPVSDGTTAADGTVTPTAAADEENADANITNSDIAAGLVGADAANLADDDIEPESLTPAGQKSTKVQSAPLAGVKVREANVILNAINTLVEQAMELAGEGEANKNMVLVGAALASASFGYEMLGMDDKQKEFAEAANNYAESVELYILGLEAFAEKAAKSNGRKITPFDMQRPLPVVAGMEDEFGDLQDESGPTDEDLSGMETEDSLATDLADTADLEASLGDGGLGDEELEG